MRAAKGSARLRRLHLANRILIAVILVALVSTGAATWFAIRVTTTAFRTRLQSQLVGSASAVSSVGLAVNPGILRTLSGIVDAQIVTLGPEGTVLASSNDVVDQRLVAAVRQVASARVARSPIARTVDCGFPCMVAVSDVDGRPGAVVALVAGLSELDAITRSVANAIVVGGLLSVVVLVVVMELAVRRLVVPLEHLVAFVRGLSPGDPKRASVGADEVGELSEAFNTMLDRLDEARAAELRSGKLGLAGLFAARVAHDIRNPLSSIKLQAQLLHAQVSDADSKATLAGVLRDINQVESVVSDLMELARPGDLRREPAQLNEVVRDALQHIAAQFAYRKIAIDMRLADGLPLVALDRGRFKQALLNLLINGGEALHTGGTISVGTGRAADGAVIVEICDDGVGIPDDIRARAFEPFVSTKPDGVGLGLVNVRSVVEGHGGHVTLEPRRPRGTCARISIPVTAHG